MTDCVSTYARPHSRDAPFKFNQDQDASRYKSFQKLTTNSPRQDYEYTEKERPKTRETSGNSRHVSPRPQSPRPTQQESKPRSTYSASLQTSFEFRSLDSGDVSRSDVTHVGSRANSAQTRQRLGDITKGTYCAPEKPTVKQHEPRITAGRTERTNSSLRKMASDSDVHKLAASVQCASGDKTILIRKAKPASARPSTPIKALRQHTDSALSRPSASSRSNRDTISQANGHTVPPWQSDTRANRLGGVSNGMQRSRTFESNRPKQVDEMQTTIGHESPQPTPPRKSCTPNHASAPNVPGHVSKEHCQQRPSHSDNNNMTALAIGKANNTHHSVLASSNNVCPNRSEDPTSVEFTSHTHKSTLNQSQIGVSNQAHNTRSEESITKQNNGQIALQQHKPRAVNVDSTLGIDTRSKNGHDIARRSRDRLLNPQTGELVLTQRKTSTHFEENISPRPPTPFKGKQRQILTNDNSRRNIYPSLDETQKSTQLSTEKLNNNTFLEIDRQNIINRDLDSDTHKNIDCKPEPYDKGREQVNIPKDTFNAHGGAQLAPPGAPNVHTTTRTNKADRSHNEHNKRDNSEDGTIQSLKHVDKYNKHRDNLNLDASGGNKSQKVLRAREKLNIGLRRPKDNVSLKDKSVNSLNTRPKLNNRGRTDSNILPSKVQAPPLPGKTFRSVSNENFLSNQNKYLVDQPHAISGAVPVLDASKGLTQTSTRAVYLSSQSLDNFSNFNVYDFKRALHKFKSAPKFETQLNTVPETPTRGLDSALSGYSTVSIALDDITEDESECEDDVELVDDHPPWRQSIDTHTKSTAPSNSPWHSTQTHQSPNPAEGHHSDASKPRANFLLTKPYLQNSRANGNTFQSDSMPNLNHKVATMPSYASSVNPQMNSNRLSISTEPQLRTRPSDRQISVAVTPFQSSSMVNIRSRESDSKETNGASWNAGYSDNRPKSRRVRIGSLPKADPDVGRETPVPRNSPVTSPMATNSRQFTSPTELGRNNNIYPSRDRNNISIGKSSDTTYGETGTKGQSLDTIRERPLSGRGLTRHQSLQSVDIDVSPRTTNAQSLTNTRPARPQSSKGRARIPVESTPPSDNSHSHAPKSRPKSSKGRSRMEPLSFDDEDLQLDLSSIDKNKVSDKDRPDSAWKKNYRKPKDIDLDDSGNDTDVDGEIEILDLDKIDQQDSHDSWSDLEVGVTGIPSQDNIISGSSSRSSRSDSAWEAHRSSFKSLSNGFMPSNQRNVDTNLDTHHNSEEYIPDTPRLTPMQNSIRKSHNAIEINGRYPYRSIGHERDGCDTHKHYKSSIIHRPNDGIDRIPFYKSSDPIPKQKQHEQSSLIKTNNGRIHNEKTVSKYRQRVVLDKETSGMLSSDAIQESRFGARKNRLAPIPRKLEPLSSTSNHGDSDCDLASKLKTSPDSGIGELSGAKSFRQGGLLTKPQIKTGKPKHKENPIQSLYMQTKPIIDMDPHAAGTSSEALLYQREHRPSYPDLYRDRSGINSYTGHSERLRPVELAKKPIRHSRSLPLK